MFTLPERYNLRSLKKAIYQPSLLTREFKRLVSIPENSIRKRRLINKYGSERKITEYDWDNLIILDACRYDIFTEEINIQGNLSPILSNSGHSSEFMKNNFQGNELHDTTYISANPYTQTLLTNNTFFKKVETYSDANPPSVTRTRKRSAERVYNAAMHEIENQQHKRIIIHFMQPHTPYHGDKARKLRKKLRKEGLTFKSWTDSEKERDDSTVYRDLHDVAKNTEYITPTQLRELYIDNLHYVLEYVKRLLENLEGKTVITADHGELLGRPNNKFGPNYWHQRGKYYKELRIVPWLEVKNGDRRKIVSEKPKQKTAANQEELEEQLKHLGYKT